MGVHEVVDNADTGFSNFAIKYLSRNEKFAKPCLPVHMGINLLSQKMVKNLVTLSLKRKTVGQATKSGVY